MGLETGTYISDLLPQNPPPTDPRSQGADHIRLIKAVLKNTFPSLKGAVTLDQDTLNALPTSKQDALGFTPVAQLVNDATTGMQSLGFNTQQKIVAATDTAGTVYFLPQTYTDSQTSYVQEIGYVPDDGTGAPYLSIKTSAGSFGAAMRPWVSAQLNNKLNSTANDTSVGDAPIVNLYYGGNVDRLWACVTSSTSGALAWYADVTTVQANLTSAVSEQANTNSSLSGQIADKLSTSTGGTVNGDLHIGGWVYTNTITDNGQGYINVSKPINVTGDVHVSGWVYSDGIHSQTGGPISVLDPIITNDSVSVGGNFSGAWSDASNPIGGSTVGSYLTGSSMFLYGGDTTPAWIGCSKSNNLINFVNDGKVIGGVSNNGSSVSFNTTSDYRLKQDVEPLDGAAAAEAVMAMRPVTHRWVADPSGPTTHGFLAHELQQVAPYAVSGQKDAVTKLGNVIPQTVDYSKIVPDLTAALRNALLRIKTLETQIMGKEGQK